MNIGEGCQRPLGISRNLLKLYEASISSGCQGKRLGKDKTGKWVEAGTLKGLECLEGKFELYPW
jgi:hypothetical protein